MYEICNVCNFVTPNFDNTIVIYDKNDKEIYDGFICENCIEKNELKLISCKCYYGKSPLLSKRCKYCERPSYKLTKSIKVLDYIIHKTLQN